MRVISRFLGAGKTTLVEILAGKHKSGHITGSVKFLASDGSLAAPRIGFVPQQDVLPPTLTVHEALLFAARLRLPESIPDKDKRELVDELMSKLGISSLRDVRIGYSGDLAGGKARGISGGEMRRVSIGLELIARPDVLILDEPTSGLSICLPTIEPSIISLFRSGLCLCFPNCASPSFHRTRSGQSNTGHHFHPSAEVCTPPHIYYLLLTSTVNTRSSQLYQCFDTILLLSHGRTLYSGPGLFAPSDYFATVASNVVPAYPQGYNVADYLLEVASDPHVSLFQLQKKWSSEQGPSDLSDSEAGRKEERSDLSLVNSQRVSLASRKTSKYATMFLTQLQFLSGREWKVLKRLAFRSLIFYLILTGSRDKTLFFTHVGVASVLGVFCGTYFHHKHAVDSFIHTLPGGLYFHTNTTIAGFQSRVGCLFFLVSS
jgi:ABC-type uncharacterized transport system YnjBCD ATPase subunit